MWFAAKRQGYGSSWPVSWEGWLSLAVFLAAIAATRYMAVTYFHGGEQVVAHIVGFAGSTMVFIAVARSRTDGGWVWRGSPKANEMVRGTISSDERREQERAAGTWRNGKDDD